MSQKLASAFASGDAAAAAALFTNDAVYLDRALRVRILGKQGDREVPRARAGNDTIRQGLKAHARRR
jgi:ketosteroid isomerase-like protein